MLALDEVFGYSSRSARIDLKIAKAAKMIYEAETNLTRNGRGW